MGDRDLIRSLAAAVFIFLFLTSSARSETVVYDRFPGSDATIAYQFFEDGHTEIKFSNGELRAVEIPAPLIKAVSSFNILVGLPEQIRTIRRAGEAAATIIQTELGLVWVNRKGVYSQPIPMDFDVQLWKQLSIIEVDGTQYYLNVVAEGSFGNSRMDGILVSGKDGSFIRFEDVNLNLSEYAHRPIYFENGIFQIPAFMEHPRVALKDFQSLAAESLRQATVETHRKTSPNYPDPVFGQYKNLKYELKPRSGARLLVPHSLKADLGKDPWESIQSGDYFQKHPGAWFSFPELSEHYHDYFLLSDPIPDWMRKLKEPFSIYHRGPEKWEELGSVRPDQIPSERITIGNLLKLFSNSQKCQELLIRAKI